MQAVNEHGGKAARYFATDLCDGIAQGHDGINYSLAHREAIVDLVFGESAKALANVDWIGIGSFASAFFVLRKLKWNPILTMCLCGVAGLGLHILLGI